MIFRSNRVRNVIATKPVDFRKGHDGLTALVKNELRKEPFTGTVFVFRSKRADWLKLLYWEGTGLDMTYTCRKLHEVSQTGTTPIADEGLKQIGKLYRIEKDIRGLSPDVRRAARQERSKPIIKAFEVWLTANRARVSVKFPIGEALKYIAKYWHGLILFLDDGRIELESNAVERTIRPIAVVVP